MLALVIGVCLLGAQLWAYSVFAFLLAASFGFLSFSAYQGSLNRDDEDG